MEQLRNRGAEELGTLPKSSGAVVFLLRGGCGEVFLGSAEARSLAAMP
jgi:hypothetical protein